MRKIMIMLAMVFLLGTTGAHAFELGNVEIHGFASQGYLKSDHNDYLVPSEEGSFEFNEAAINFAAPLTDRLRFGLQLNSLDLGEIGNNDVELDWAFLDYEWKECLGLKAGKFKAPFGLYNEIQDYDMLYTWVLLPQSVYNKYSRESAISVQGGGIYGKKPLGAAGNLRYDLFAGTMDMDTDGGVAKQTARETRGDVDSITMNYTAGGRVNWETPLDGLLLSATAYQWDIEYDIDAQIDVGGGTILPANMNTELSDARSYMLGAQYSFGNFTAAAEYLTYDGDIETDIDFPDPVPDVTRIQDYQPEGYYGMISYRFTDWFEAGTYYSVFYSDKDDHGGDDQVQDGRLDEDFQAWQKDLALTARFDINEYWLVKLEMHFMDGVALASQTSEGPYEEDWILYGIKTTVTF